MDSFPFDPILTDFEYPDLTAAFPELPIVLFNRKHFYLEERNKLQELDKTAYILVSPHANLSLIGTVLERDGEKYLFSPVYYSQSEKNLKRFQKYGVEVTDSIDELRHILFGFE